MQRRGWWRFKNYSIHHEGRSEGWPPREEAAEIKSQFLRCLPA